MIINHLEDTKILIRLKNLINYYNNIKFIAPIIKDKIQKEKCTQYNFNANYLKRIWLLQLHLIEDKIDINEEFKVIKQVIIYKIKELEEFTKNNLEINYKNFELIDSLFNIIYKENYPIYLKPILSKHILDLKKFGFKNLSIYKGINSLFDSIIENLTEHYFKLMIKFDSETYALSLEEQITKNILENENINKNVFNLEKNPLPFEYKFLEFLHIYINNKQDKEGFVFNIDYRDINKNIEILYSLVNDEITKALNNLYLVNQLDGMTENLFLSEMERINAENFSLYFLDLEFKETLGGYYEVLLENLPLSHFINLMDRLNDSQEKLIINHLDFFKENKFENTVSNLEKYIFAKKINEKLIVKNESENVNKI